MFAFLTDGRFGEFCYFYSLFRYWFYFGRRIRLGNIGTKFWRNYEKLIHKQTELQGAASQSNDKQEGLVDVGFDLDKSKPKLVSSKGLAEVDEPNKLKSVDINLPNHDDLNLPNGNDAANRGDLPELGDLDAKLPTENNEMRNDENDAPAQMDEPVADLPNEVGAVGGENGEVKNEQLQQQSPVDDQAQEVVRSSKRERSAIQERKYSNNGTIYPDNLNFQFFQHPSFLSDPAVTAARATTTRTPWIGKLKRSSVTMLSARRARSLNLINRVNLKVKLEILIFQQLSPIPT